MVGVHAMALDHRAAITLAEIDALTRGRFGTLDVACPLCGPERRSAVNQRRPVLRVWRSDPDFATFCCARCGEKGFATAADRDHHRPSPAEVQAREAARAQAEAVAKAARAKRHSLAEYLWLRREPAQGSPVETYLREVRGFTGRIPDTIGYLPGRGDHAPAMVAGFGLADEPVPGAVSLPVAKLRGVHLTKLKPDGSGKAGSDKDRLMIGYSAGWPIVAAPMNDLLGLAIIEGIEKGLAYHQVTGLGVWVAGAAARMQSLLSVVPQYTDCITVCIDEDKDGQRHGLLLANALAESGFHVETVML